MNDLQENKHSRPTKYITGVLLEYLAKNSAASDQMKDGLIREQLCIMH